MMGSKVEMSFPPTSPGLSELRKFDDIVMCDDFLYSTLVELDLTGESEQVMLEFILAEQKKSKTVRVCGATGVSV
jgi:hypothetical protein